MSRLAACFYRSQNREREDVQRHRECKAAEWEENWRRQREWEEWLGPRPSGGEYVVYSRGNLTNAQIYAGATAREGRSGAKVMMDLGIKP